MWHRILNLNKCILVWIQGKKRTDRLELLASGAEQVRQSLDLLGFDSYNPNQVLCDIRKLTLARADMTEEAVQSMIEMRKEVSWSYIPQMGAHAVVNKHLGTSWKQMLIIVYCRKGFLCVLTTRYPIPSSDFLAFWI